MNVCAYEVEVKTTNYSDTTHYLYIVTDSPQKIYDDKKIYDDIVSITKLGPVYKLKGDQLC